MEAKRSAFRYRNLRLLKFEFSGEHLDESECDDISIETKVIVIYVKEDIANVTLQIQLGDNEKSAFSIKATMNATFNWDEGVNHEVLLKENAPALLFSFFRPLVTTVTSQAGISKVDLPFIDFTNHEAEVIAYEDFLKAVKENGEEQLGEDN